MQLIRLPVERRADVAAVAALVAWAVAAAGATLVRPGELLEMALVGAAAIGAWGILAAPGLSLRTQALGAVVFALPLVNTWPARSFVSALTDAPVLVQALLTPSTILLVGLILVAPERRPPRATLPYAVAAVVLVAAASIASVFAADAADALRATLHVYALPAAAGLITAASVRRAREGWALIHVAALAAAVPALVGAAAYVLSFGVPVSGADLVAAKIALVRPHLFQELTFGNVSHLAALALLLLPAAMLATARRGVPAWLRAAAGIAAAALLLALVLTASRSALAVAGVELLALVALLARCRSRWLLVPAAGLTVLVIVALSPAMRSSYGTLVPSVDNVDEAQVGPAGGGGSTSVGIGPVTVDDPSAADRAEAVRTGIEIARDNLPFGVGTSQYVNFDETFTAPHSLAVQVLAESGPAAFLALLAVTALLLMEASRTFARLHSDDDATLLRGACLAGSLGLLLHGAVAGAPFAIGPVNVWAVAFWIQVGVIAGLRAGADAE